MGRVSTSVVVPGPLAAAEALWYDPARMASWVDGFAHAVRVDPDWPQAGAALVWDSHRGGRGRVVERAVAHVPGDGQALDVEDPRLRGRQTVAFRALADGEVEVALTLEYRLKGAGPLVAVTDLLFVRRALGDSLRRTLVRFERELEAAADSW